MLFPAPIAIAAAADGPLWARVGALAAVNYGIRPLGAVVGGLLGTWIGLRPTLLVAALGGSLCVLWLLPSPIPGIRALTEQDA